MALQERDDRSRISRRDSLWYNQAEHIQEEIISLTDEQLEKYREGPEYPKRRVVAEAIDPAWDHKKTTNVSVPDGWRVLRTFTESADHSTPFSTRTEEKWDANHVRVVSVQFTLESGYGGACSILLEPS
ncbi:MAG TPA: hypothetical protein VF345_02025 [Chthoniobacterales bacterium]